MTSKVISFEREQIRLKALRAISPLKAVDATTAAPPQFLFSAVRTEAGRELPPYYLVYFLLVDLLGFRNIGQFEKIAWSVPVDFNGQAFLIEHRKFGVGVFAEDLARDEPAAREIVVRIHRGVKAAQPFFDSLAAQAVAQSHVNVINISSELFDRYEYLRDQYHSRADEATRRKDERVAVEGTNATGDTWKSVSFLAYRLRLEAAWLALSAIEAFFSWTEHCFIHLSLLAGSITTASEVTSLAEAEWSEKFKNALDLSDNMMKAFYDRLMSMRQELRNYIAHGAFGKQGEAFTFHTGAGAVPVLLPHRAGTQKFKLGHGLEFDIEAAIDVLERFRAHLWSGSRAPAEIYIQQSHLPVILTMVADGTYRTAMISVEGMTESVGYLSHESDRAANMDW